jgi:hypothetical protein
MFKQLKLGLRRHELAWKMEQLEKIIDELLREGESFSGDPAIKKQLDEYCLVAVAEFFKYKNMFEETI